MSQNEHRPIFPPLRTFTVVRPNLQKESTTDVFRRDTVEQIVEAHRYYVDNSGALCFEQHVWDMFTKQPCARMPICMAHGTWWNVVEISKHLEVRPSGSVN